MNHLNQAYSYLSPTTKSRYTPEAKHHLLLIGQMRTFFKDLQQEIKEFPLKESIMKGVYYCDIK